MNINNDVRTHPLIAPLFVLALVAMFVVGGQAQVPEANAQGGSIGSRVFVSISVNGQKIDTEYPYDSSMADLAGQDLTTTNEAFDFSARYRRAARGELMVDPVAFTIRTGKSTPTLMQAMADGSRVDLEVLFFGPDLDTGETFRTHTYEIAQGVITGYELVQPSFLDPETATHPLMVRLEVAGTTHDIESAFGTTAHYEPNRR